MEHSKASIVRTLWNRRDRKRVYEEVEAGGTHLEEARLLLELLELGLDPVATPQVRRVPSAATAAAADLHRRPTSGRGLVRSGEAQANWHSGSVSGLGKRAGGEEDDEELSRNAGGQTRKVLPFLVNERGLGSDSGGLF